MITKTTFSQVEDAFIKIGYRHNLIRRDYQFSDLLSPGVPVRTIGRAIFGQEPLDYRSACFGLQLAAPNQASDIVVNHLRALGAPQILLVNNGVTERWAVTEKDSRLLDKYKTANLHNVIVQNQQNWNPQSIIRAKSGFSRPDPTQLDFVDIGLLPALEHEAARKIDTLLSLLLNHTEEEFKKRRLAFDASLIFRIVFSLLAAKLLKDRDFVGSAAIDFSVPQTALNAVSEHYGPSLSSVSKLPVSVLSTISSEIGQSFSLKNISVDTLTYIYENTFVTPESRRSFGIHSTPSYVADYLLSQVPIENLPRNYWHTLDPMSGHGILLIAAMRRMRDLLPRDWGGQRRHKFFIDHLHGIEIEPFSVEVARMCLMLADFPEANGWDIQQQDAFADAVLENNAQKTMILIANPPFEKTRGKAASVPKPLEFIKRTLPHLPQESLIGLILPRSFLDSTTYKHERKLLIDNFEISTITTLPDRIFLRSYAETTLITARKKKPKSLSRLIYREVRDPQRDIFKTKYGVTWQEKVSQSHFSETQSNKLVVPLLSSLWDRLKSNSHIDDIADIKTGIRYKARLSDAVVLESDSTSGGREGIFNISDTFYQYDASNTVYMSMNKQYIQNAAINCIWEAPKVIIPAARMARGPWRYAAAIDTQKRVFSRRFYGAWPKSSEISVYTLAALLNSPIPQAFVYCNTSERDILIRTYNGIPIPRIEELVQANTIITDLVKEYLKDLETNNPHICKTLLKIDALMLKLYSLSPKLERQLLDIFWGENRHVPFEFKGYIPPEMVSWIPLHIYISDAFNEGTLEKIMSRMPVIKDKKFIDYLKKVGTE